MGIVVVWGRPSTCVVPSSYFEAQVPCWMAINNSSSKQPMPTSPFRSTKLNSGLTVMSSLTLSVSILATGYVKSPKKSHETCDATGLWASALAVLLQFSQKYPQHESVVGTTRKPVVDICITPSPVLAVLAVGSPARRRARSRHCPVVGCGCVVFTAELQWDGSTAQQS